MAGIVAGIALPYQSLALVWASSLLLALLLVINAAAVSLAETAASLQAAPARAALLLFLLFGALAPIQTLLASLLLHDAGYVFGVAAASLAPPALVVPLFLRRNGGNTALGVALVVIGTLLCPVLTPPALELFGVNAGYVDTRALFLTMIPLTVLPVAAGLALPRLWPAGASALRQAAPRISSLLLGVLLFILVGSSLPRLPLRAWYTPDLAWILALMIWMDFGVYFLFRALLGETAAIILSARNFAVTAGLLLFFDPRAALPSAIGLAVHAVFFQWLMVKKAPRPQSA